MNIKRDDTNCSIILTPEFSRQGGYIQNLEAAEKDIETILKKLDTFTSMNFECFYYTTQNLNEVIIKGKSQRKLQLMYEIMW